MCCIFHKDKYVQLGAMHYYIQYGSANNKGHVQKVVEECIPIHLIEHSSMSKWIHLISAAHQEVWFCMKSAGGAKKIKSKKNCHLWSDDCILVLQGPQVSRSQSRESVKEEIVDSACRKWPLNFSRFYEVIQKSGASTQKNISIMWSNWSSSLD